MAAIAGLALLGCFDSARGQVTSGNLGASFTVTTSASPAAGGATSGDGVFADGSSVTVVATPAAGYKFSKWQEGATTVSTSASYTFAVTADRNLVAKFKQVFTIATSASPANGGSTGTDSTVYVAGDTAHLTAAPNAGFVFVNWTENGVPVSTAPNYSFSVSASRTLVANFAPPAVTISTSEMPAAGGISEGGGTFIPGTGVTVLATPNAGYAFVNWTEGGTVVGTAPSFTFLAGTSRVLVANFTVGRTISTASIPVSTGCTLGDGTYADGASVTVSATPSTGFVFDNWTENGLIVSTSATYTFSAGADRALLAHFTQDATALVFDFDSGTPALTIAQAAPLDQAASGVTAHFASPSPAGFSVQDAASAAVSLSSFSGKFLHSFGAGGVLEIQFDSPVSGISMKFATADAPGAAPSTVHVTAYQTSTAAPPVGGSTAEGTWHAGDSMPSGVLALGGSAPFTVVRIEISGAGLTIDDIGVTPATSLGPVTLANPNWNITLSDFGYSDYAIDNTPGFEGREYLSGEWGAAVGYQKASGTVAPTWLEPNFLYPDWATNSNFHVVSPITVLGSNAGGLPIAQSVVANPDMEITLRFEMLDTIVGTPMGIKPVSAAGTPASINSNRYVLKQTVTIRNISQGPLSNVQLFQLLHGINVQKGVYDNRGYTGPLSAYQFDTTLSGVDMTVAGNGGTSEGLEDFIALHSQTAPSAFEIGRYGVEGVDDHVVGKPSDGVHLSIENNWLTQPFSSRLGTDSFAPGQYWVSGAQRWNLGSIAPGQSLSHDVILSLLTGTKAGAGIAKTGSCNGGAGHAGGFDFEIDDVTGDGTVFGAYSGADATELAERIAEGEFALPNFSTPGGLTQVWEVKFSGTHSGQIHLTFAYDPALLPVGFDESTLAIYHYHGGAWEKMAGTVDTATHTIAISTASLSPFMLGMGSSPVIYSQPPSVAGGLYQSSWMSPDGSDYDQFVWDSFTLASTQSISEIDWRGGFIYGGGYGGPVTGFTVSIYGSIAAGTEPDIISPPLKKWHVDGNAGQTAAGTVNGVAMYDYRFVLPTAYTVTGGVKYWLQIEADQSGIPEWALAAGTGGNGGHFREIAAAADKYYQMVSGDTAFTLVGAAPTQLTWAGNGTTNLWNTTSASWRNGTSAVAYANGNAVLFDDSSSNLAVTLGQAVSPGDVVFSNSSKDYTLTGTGGIAGSTGLTKTGTGTVNLQTANSYAGATQVNAGTLNLMGSITGGGALTIGVGATLAGSGSHSGPVTVNGAVHPTGTLQVGVTTYNGGGSQIVTVSDADAGPGTLSAAGGIMVYASSGNPFAVVLVSSGLANFDPNRSYAWTIATATPGVGGFFNDSFVIDTTQFSNDLAGGSFSVSGGGPGIAVVFTPHSDPVAQPATVCRARGQPLAISIAALVPLWSSPDGDATVFLSVDPVSANGASVRSDGTNIYYDAGDANANDTITYTITDTHAYRAGDTRRIGRGTIGISVVQLEAGQCSLKADPTCRTASAVFVGTPGTTYRVQRSTDLASWVDLASMTAPSGGVFGIDDAFADLGGVMPPRAFYRLMMQ